MPLSQQKPVSKFSIQSHLNSKDSEEEETIKIPIEKDVPQNHFTDTDLDKEWKTFLIKIKQEDIVLFYAINGFKISKKDESTVHISYPSESARNEFEKVQSDFFNHFMRKVNHFKIKVEYTMDVKLKQEVITKRTLFEKMVEINPVLKDLDDLMKFDFS